MKKKRSRKLGLLLAVLIIALIGVIALMAHKQLEYSASAAFYESLRGGGVQ